MKEVVLIILLFFSNGDTRHKEYPMDSIKQCIEVLDHTRVGLPHTDNGHEGIAIVSCGYRYKEE